MNNKQRFWIAFILILTFSVIDNQFFFDTKKYITINKSNRNALELGSILLVYFVGLIYFAQKGLNNLRKLWLITYLGSICFLGITIFIDYFIWAIEKNGQYRFSTLKNMLISPVPFLIFVLINKLYFSSIKPTKKL